MKRFNRAILTCLAVLHVAMSFATVAASPLSDFAGLSQDERNRDAHFSSSIQGQIDLNTYFESSTEEETDSENEASSFDDGLCSSLLLFRKYQRYSLNEENDFSSYHPLQPPLYLLLEDFRL